jgi:hypothetical protein
MSVPTLTAPFSGVKDLNKGGRTFSYIPAPEVIDRLNAVIGVGQWSYTVDVVHFDDTFIVVKGHFEAYGSVQEQFGGQKINKTKTGDIIDLGDDFKGAASDAMKKCVQPYGVGLYLSLGHSPLSARFNAGQPIENGEAGD